MAFDRAAIVRMGKEIGETEQGHECYQHAHGNPETELALSHFSNLFLH
jgi:hypothetical protein